MNTTEPFLAFSPLLITCQPHTWLLTVCAYVAGPEIFHGWSTKVPNDLRVWRRRGLFHLLQGHQRWSAVSAERTDEDTRGQQQTQLCYLTPQFLWSLDYLWGAEDTEFPHWHWSHHHFGLGHNEICLPFFMRHRERQQPCVHITMYNIVCIIFWTDFNCNCVHTCNNTKYTQKNQPRISKKMFLKVAHLLAAVLQTALTQLQL